MSNVFVRTQNTDLITSFKSNLDERLYSITSLEDMTMPPKETVDLLFIDVLYERERLELYCRNVREQDEVIGIVVYGDSFDEEEIGRLFGLGIDAYIAQTLPMTRVAMIIERICKRVEQIKMKEKEIESKNTTITLDYEKRIMYKNKEVIKLTSIEYEMMVYFMKNPQVAISRNQLLDWIWGSSYVGDPKVIDVNVMRLRQKIEDDPKKPSYICTVWGYGYRWEGK